MNCCFIGHGTDVAEGIYDLILAEVNALVRFGVTNFLCGGHGDFDKLCICAVGEVKKKYPHIRNFIILAYNTPSQINRYENEVKNYGAETLYPFKVALDSKLAIPFRNSFIVDKSDYCIAYVYRKFGGAVQSLNYAISKKITIVNLANVQFKY